MHANWPLVDGKAQSASVTVHQYANHGTASVHTATHSAMVGVVVEKPGAFSVNVHAPAMQVFAYKVSVWKAPK